LEEKQPILGQPFDQQCVGSQHMLLRVHPGNMIFFSLVPLETQQPQRLSMQLRTAVS
jgi:hypothetical protein